MGFVDRCFAAVLFDLDGTLANSWAGIIRAWTQWAGEYGITEEQLKDVAGHSSAGIAEQLLAPGVREEAIARIEQLETEHAHDTGCMPGARDAWAGALGHRAIVTAGVRPVALARITAAGLEVPEVLVTSSEVTRAKPDPEPYATAARLLGVDPSECLACEDTPAGLQSARGAGCTTVGVQTMPGVQLQADVVVPDLSHVSVTATDGGVRATIVR